MKPIRKSLLLPVLLTVFIDLIGVGIVLPVLAPLFLSSTSPFAGADWSFATRTILIGLIAAVYPIAQFFGAPYLGALSDRLGRKPVLLVSLFGTLVGYVFFGFAIRWHLIWLLFLSRALDGFTGGNMSTAQSAIADVSTEETKPRNFGFVGLAYGLGFILGPFIGGELALTFSSAAPFWFAAGLTLVNIVLVAYYFEETLKQPLKSRISFLTGFENLGKALQLGRLRTIFLVSFLFTLGFNFFTQFFQVLVIQKYHFTAETIGHMFAYVGVWVALTQGLATPLAARRWKPEQVLSFALLFFSLTLGSLMLPHAPWVLYVFTPFTALAVGLINPNTTTIISDLADEKSQGEIMGISQSVGSLAMAVPPVIAGFIAGVNVYFPIVLAALFGFIAWVVFMAFFRGRATPVFHEK